MTERLIVQPPEIVEVEGPVIFLAGPIQGAPDWQSEAAATIHQLDPAIVVASPAEIILKEPLYTKNRLTGRHTFCAKPARRG